MAKKTKYEVKETEKTKATFTLADIDALQAGAYAAARRHQYLQSVAARPKNPRLNDRGEEVLSPISLVADADMAPLTTRQNLARFQVSNLLENGDGFDSETDIELDRDGQPTGRVLVDDRDYHVSDRTDDPPTPHELRARSLDKKLSRARAAHQADLEEKRKKGETPTHKEKNPNEPELPLSPKDGN